MGHLKTTLRIAIASETIKGGGLLHYLGSLDAALRENIPMDCKLVSSPFTVVSRTRDPGAVRTLVHGIKRIPIMRNVAKWLYRKVSSGSWPEVEQWARYWRSLPRDIHVLLPHIVLNDRGQLDAYYAAISERTVTWVIHDLHPYYFPSQWTAKSLQLMHERFSLFAQKAASIIVHNEFTAEDVCRRLGVPRKKISIVRLPPIFKSRTSQVDVVEDQRLLQSVGLQGPYALWASSSTYSHKNHEGLLEAWKILLDQGHDLHLVCSGEKGPRWNEVSQRIRALKLQGHVTFTGVVANEVLDALIRNARIAVCPTLFEGGGSGPASEAVMAQVPAIVSNIRQVREQFDDRDDMCFFCDASDPQLFAASVKQVLENYEVAKRRAEFAKEQYIFMRSWDVAAEQYWTALRKK